MSIHHPIIVIDEDHDDLRLLSDAHHDLKINSPLISFSTCEQAISYLQEDIIRPRLIICDYRFRTMNGPQLKRLLNNLNPRLRQIPFVIWSSVLDPIDLDEVDELQIQSLLLKPSTYVDLLSTYSNIINRWAKVYHNMHCPNALQSRLSIPGGLMSINVISACASLI